MRSLIESIAVVFALFLSSVSSAYSVSYGDVTREEALRSLRERSPFIVQGIVESTTSREAEPPAWFPPGRPAIVTDLRIRVVRVLKDEKDGLDTTGSSRTRYETVTIPGGCLEEKGICLTGDLFPSIEAGEALTLYLENSGERHGYWQVTDPVLGIQRKGIKR